VVEVSVLLLKQTTRYFKPLLLTMLTACNAKLQCGSNTAGCRKPTFCVVKYGNDSVSAVLMSIKIQSSEL